VNISFSADGSYPPERKAPLDDPRLPSQQPPAQSLTTPSKKKRTKKVSRVK
jgi:hypothetical protein